MYKNKDDHSLEIHHQKIMDNMSKIENGWRAWGGAHGKKYQMMVG